MDSSISPPSPIPLWTIKFSWDRDKFSHFAGCTGTLTIEQTGSTFTGSFMQQDNCPTVAGVLTNGVVRPDGSVTFSLVGPASDPLAWTRFASCAATVSGTMNFTGTVNGNLLDASFAHDALMECPNEGFVTVNVRLRGAR
jgi:hypothetical protein